MGIKLDSETERYLLESIKRFFVEELEQDIGDLKARAVLEFCIREIGPSVYNRAIADAQAFVQNAVSDLDGVQFEPEFAYWKRSGSGS
ncbi:MAG: DUF2164 domain-containing protein [Coriobacteriia bacterium]|mgnify:CR=1 FL=1|jgi:uncharacterized protein (DUF2164 family)|nr:DUF2164 domain-containing protein [Coriobacteriia bacterium]